MKQFLVICWWSKAQLTLCSQGKWRLYWWFWLIYIFDDLQVSKTLVDISGNPRLHEVLSFLLAGEGQEGVPQGGACCGGVALLLPPVQYVAVLSAWSTSDYFSTGWKEPWWTLNVIMNWYYLSFVYCHIQTFKSHSNMWWIFRFPRISGLPNNRNKYLMLSKNEMKTSLTQAKKIKIWWNKELIYHISKSPFTNFNEVLQKWNWKSREIKNNNLSISNNNPAMPHPINNSSGGIPVVVLGRSQSTCMGQLQSPPWIWSSFKNAQFLGASGVFPLHVVPWFICHGEHRRSKCTQSVLDTRPRPIQYAFERLWESGEISHPSSKWARNLRLFLCYKNNVHTL